jgi:hypothetical protein
MRIPFEERVNRCLSRSPGCVAEMSLRIARRGEGAAIDEDGFSLYRRLPRAGISSGAGASNLTTSCPRRLHGMDRYFPRALPEAISSADRDSLEREDCHT